MLDIKLFNPFVRNFGSNMTEKLSKYSLVYKLKPAKKTGNFMGMKTFNHIFNNLKADYYQLFIHNLGDKQLLFKELGHWARIQKIKKYYTDGYYQNIKDVIIQGENQVTPLLEALALWVDYDLIKKYYKGFDIEKIDKTLWAWSTCYFNYYHKHEKTTSEKSFELRYNLQDKDLLSMKPKFNLLRFVWLLYKDEIPLVYKDGVLIIDKYNMFRDLSVYKANSVGTAVKNIIKKLLDKNLNLHNFLNGDMWYYMGSNVIEAFPYVFVLGWTGYGYALNVYKFNPEKMGFEPVKDFKVERPLIGSGGFMNEIKFVNANGPDDINGLINNNVWFWFDEEYVYFYIFLIHESDDIIYKVKRSDVEFLGVKDNTYYFRIFGKLIRIELDNIHNFHGFGGMATYAENGKYS